jgi:Tol biopolymer transport system component
MDADGANLRRLTNNSARDWQPSWSPDGTRIAFGSDRSGHTAIYTMNPDGSGLQQLTQNDANDDTPSWRP